MVVSSGVSRRLHCGAQRPESAVVDLLPAARATRISPVQAMTSARTESEVGLGKRAVIGSVMAAVGVVGIVLGVLDVVGKPVAWAGAGMALTMIGVALASPLLGRPAFHNLRRRRGEQC